MDFRNCNFVFLYQICNFISQFCIIIIMWASNLFYYLILSSELNNINSSESLCESLVSIGLYLLIF